MWKTYAYFQADILPSISCPSGNLKCHVKKIHLIALCEQKITSVGCITLDDTKIGELERERWTLRF